MPTDHATPPDALWVPLLTHFRRHGSGLAVDANRMASQIRAMQPDVRQFMLAGSTGDGWEMGLDHLLDIVRLTRRAEVFGETRILFGVLRPTTEEVVAWAQAVERALAADGPPAGTYMGLTVCPPVQKDAAQETILAHYRAVLAATKSPIAVYQLPQVTGCSIAPATLRAIAENPRVTMFKDTSGTDTVAQAGPLPGVLMVRGAEGGYVEALRPDGPYDGWLLSTGNVFGRALRRMLQLREAGDRERALALSAVVATMVQALFQAAGSVEFGNAFSNANRAADHVRALGRAWRSAPPPLTASGKELPIGLLEAAADIIGALPGIPEDGYIARTGSGR